MKPSEVRFKEMQRAYDAGKSITEIGKHFGISRQRVSQVFREHNVILRPNVPDSVVQNIADPERLADMYGFTVHSMRQKMRRMGFSFSRKPYTKRKWNLEVVKQMYSDYLNGMTQKQVADKYNTKQTEVSRLFITRGFEPKLKTGGFPRGKSRKVQP